MEGCIFQAQEVLRSGDVRVGVAQTVAEQIGRLNVVTSRYKQEGYLSDVKCLRLEVGVEKIIGHGGDGLLMDYLDEQSLSAFKSVGLLIGFPDGLELYIDKYHWASVPFVAEDRDGYIGSARLILKGDSILPTLEDVEIYERYKQGAETVNVEFSQFAVERGSSPLSASVGLLRATVGYSRKVLNEHIWIATTDNRVVNYLNGSYFHFQLPSVGSPVYYLGSESTPILIDINLALDNASLYSKSSNIAKFIRGDLNVEGFDWYKGE